MKKNILTLVLASITFVGFAQETYTLSSESTLTIDGTSTLHDWTVTANTMDGKLVAEGTAPKEIDFEVLVADIKSERGATMDKKTHNALKMEDHPKVTFKLKEVKGSSSMVGTLNIAGYEKEVEIETEMTNASGQLKIKGEKPIKLQDYDMEPPSAMFGQIVVGDDVVVKFDLVFTK